MREVVVVLPFEPVMQIFFAESYRLANSISDIISMPFSLIFCTMGTVPGMPGDFTTSSALRMSSSVCWPCSKGMSHLRRVSA